MNSTIQWARQMLEVAFVCDSETTGLSETAEAVELSIVRAKDRAVIFNSLLRASQPCEKGAADVHGITPDQIARAPRPVDVWPEIQAAVNGKIVIAYNAKFDERILKSTAAIHRLDPLVCTWECLMLRTMSALGIKARGYALWKACAHFGVQPGAHRALGDCIAALDVLSALAGQTVDPPDDPLPMMAVGDYLLERGWIKFGGENLWQQTITTDMNTALAMERARD